ncbi:MAG: nuclear transport factor 2 family protein [Chitinophagaceae bacterium]
MLNNNQAIVDSFFEAYIKRDFAGIHKVMHEDVTWIFLGQHPLAGVKNGIEDVVAFFDNMGAIMGQSKVKAEKLVMGSNDNYLVECQHITTHREDGNNVDHHVCVLWTFEDNKIREGRHFFADPKAADKFFAAVAPIPTE